MEKTLSSRWKRKGETSACPPAGGEKLITKERREARGRGPTGGGKEGVRGCEAFTRERRSLQVTGGRDGDRSGPGRQCVRAVPCTDDVSGPGRG